MLLLAIVITVASTFFICYHWLFNTANTSNINVHSLHQYSTLLDDPTGPGAMSPRLTTVHNQLYMIWLEPDAPDNRRTTALWHVKTARWQEDKNDWSSPVIIHSSNHLFINWTDAPSISATQTGQLYAHWLEKNKLNTPYAYDVQLAYSGDGSRHWQAIGTPSPEQAPHESAYDGFLSFLPSDDKMRAFWISARTPNTNNTTEEKKRMTLQTALLDQSVQQSQMLDNDICSCCNTTAIQAATGPIIFYRNHTPNEIRDIYTIRHVNGMWSEPAAVHHDNWEINGCPVNGPKAATNGELIAIAWFTAAGGKNRVKLSWSRDNGKNYSAPIDIDTLSPDGPLGQIGLVMIPDGRVIISWIGRANNHKPATIFLRHADATGNISGYYAVHEIQPHKTKSVPQLALLNDQLFMVWTENQDTKKKTVLIKIPTAALSKVATESVVEYPR